MNNNLDLYIKEYLMYLQVEKNLAPRTLTEYENDISLLKDLLTKQNCLNWNLVTYRDLRQFLHHLQEARNNSPASRARKISTLRGFFTFLCDEQLIDENPTLRLKKPKLEKKLPVYLSLEDCERFIQVLKDESPHQLRDVTIISLFLYTGIRLSELTSLEVEDIDLKAGTIRVYGKGRKERIIPLTPILVDQLLHYLEFRKLELGTKSDSISPLFYSYRNKEYHKIPNRSVHEIFKRYSKLASINQKHFSAHKLRHTFATLLYGQGVDLLQIKNLLGHQNISTTEIYTHLSTQHLKDAVSKHPLLLKDEHKY